MSLCAYQIVIHFRPNQQIRSTPKHASAHAKTLRHAAQTAQKARRLLYAPVAGPCCSGTRLPTRTSTNLPSGLRSVEIDKSCQESSIG